MTIYYDSQANAFIDSKISASIPLSAKKITQAEYLTLLKGQSEGKKIQAGTNGLPVLAEPEIMSFPDRKNKAKAAIDGAAGASRQRFVSTGTLIDMEYKLAQEQTKAWRAAGSPANDVPESITSWAAAAGMTDEEAAADIEATAIAWEQVLIAVREIRLAGKAAVDAAADQGTADDMANVAQPYIDQLDALAP